MRSRFILAYIKKQLLILFFFFIKITSVYDNLQHLINVKDLIISLIYTIYF